LYEGSPAQIIESLPALMNSIKMIHTIARYYNTNERMTGLFIKITNQMIEQSTVYILNFRKFKRGESLKKGLQQTDDVLWNTKDYPPDELIPVLKSCIQLNQAYQKQYQFTKERLMMMPKGRQFEFSTNAIFGRFDLFCRRISKLIELFETIHQFKILDEHNLEGITPIIDEFKRHSGNFQKQNHKLLGYRQNTFDRDFVAFNVLVSEVEADLQKYIDKSFENIKSVEDSLKLLKKFMKIIQRENLRKVLNSKYAKLYNNFENEVSQVEEQYSRFKSGPPIVRNLPTVSGNITWARHLYFRISKPMQQFLVDQSKSDSKSKEYKKIIPRYNKVGYTLFSFEYLWRQKWIADVEKAKAGLQATLIIRHPDNNKLYVNFDSEITTLIREAKTLLRIGIEIPETAKIVLL
jgi:dynein heavy chain